jgi:hypothetical protein
MSRPKSGNERAVDTLNTLIAHCPEPLAIEDATTRGDLEPYQLIMTSMGSSKKAIITPYYPAIQFENRLAQRISWSGIFQRPFAEAVIGYSRKRRSASLVLRFCSETDLTAISESCWQYPLDESADATRTTWDVVQKINDAAADGVALPQRSGLVVVTDERLGAGNWATSHSSNPDEVIAGIQRQIESLNFADI